MTRRSANRLAQGSTACAVDIILSALGGTNSEQFNPGSVLNEFNQSLDCGKNQ